MEIRMSDYSDALEKLRGDHELSIRKAAERAGVGDSTWSKWERGEYSPSEQSREKIESAFDVDLDEYRPNATGTPKGWVRDKSEVEHWRDAVIAADTDQWEFITLMALPSFFDEVSGIVSVSPKAIAEHMGDHYDQEDIEGAWPKVLDSDLVEVVGSGEWTLRLIIPDE